MSRKAGILERKPLVAPIVVENPEQARAEMHSLAEEAAGKLGYAGLRRRVRMALESAPNKLQYLKFIEVLAEADTNPFLGESVKRYKKIALKEARKKREKFFERNIYIIEGLGWGLVCLVFASFAGIFVGPVIGSFWGVAAETFLISTLIFLVTLLLSGPFLKWTENLNDLEWQKTKISEYNQEIPEFVLRKALQIKERAPGVEFFVEHIGEKHDPFLIAKFQDKEYYIEVWDEPKFESQLLQ